MKKTKGVLILTTAILSGVSVILCFVALGTEEWVVSDATVGTGRESNINYGLFSGTLVRNLDSTPRHFDLTMTCVNVQDGGICALSCLTTAEQREKQVRDLWTGLNITFGCLPVATARNNWKGPLVFRGNSRAFLPKENRIFINNSMYMSTIVFLCLSAIFAFISAGFSVLNTATNPVEPWFNVLGLYFYNGIACLFLIITLAIWGAEFGERISENIAIFDTLTGDSVSKGLTSLGYSYWLLLLSLLLHITNDVILLIRAYLINQEPETTTVNMDDKQDGQIMLY